MKIITLTSGELDVNSYILIDEKSKTAVVIDGGEDYALVTKTCADLGVKLVANLLTHAHYDHAGNAKRLQDDGVKCYISKSDALKLNNKDNLSWHRGKLFDRLTPDVIISDGDILNFGDISLKVIETPGHTDGSVTFMTDGALFTGDTLFYTSAGRTDFPTGSDRELLNSLKKLKSLDGDYKVYCGHGQSSTLDFERKHNYFMNYDKN